LYPIPPAMPDPGVTVPTDAVIPFSRSVEDEKDRTRCSIQFLKPPVGCETWPCSAAAAADSVDARSGFLRTPAVSGFLRVSVVSGVGRTSASSAFCPKTDAGARSIDEASANDLAHSPPPHRCLMIISTDKWPILNAPTSSTLSTSIASSLAHSADPDRRIQTYADN
jgi:hypothetical protein